jgi:uncharacterized protein YjbI with pentapeptide repeats
MAMLDVDLLLISVEEWNKERILQPDVLADLSNANLSNADLRKANLARAFLSNVNFSGADLSGADVSDAIFTGANFRNANLSATTSANAHLNEAQCFEVD